MAKKKGLWDNIHAKRKRGESPAKKGSKDYPETLDIGEGMKAARKNVGADTCWDGYKAKGTKKKDGKEVPNCVKESKSFSEFCAEGKSRIETDPDYRKRFKALADNFAEKRKAQTKEKKAKVTEQAGDGYIGPPNLNIKNPMASDATRAAGTVKRKADAKARLAAGGKTSGGIANRLQQRADMINSIGESVEILDADGNLVAEITDLILPEPMTGWRQQMATEGYKDLPKRKMGMKAGKKIISAIGHAAKAGEEDEGTIEDQVRMQKAGKKTKQADKIHKTAGKHNETLSRAKSLKNQLKGKLKEDWSKKNKGDKVDGMGDESIKAYRRENPGSKLKGAVTGDPKEGSKDAARRSSYCDRSNGQKKMHNIDCSSTPDKPICKARKRWKC